VKPVIALKVITALSAFGTAFSGVLSYRELFGAEALSCPAPGAPGTIAGYPACVYGFLVFAALLVVSTLGLIGAAKAARIAGGGPE
jgi:uncharacterized membrane protein